MPKTVSLDMARRLKEAGLKWEPKENDIMVTPVPDDSERLVYTLLPPRIVYVNQERCTWLPTLSDLLDELEARGWVYSFGPMSDSKAICLWRRDWERPTERFEAASNEDAAAQALLWVLERGEEAEHGRA
jgi:hypothetical protein